MGKSIHHLSFVSTSSEQTKKTAFYFAKKILKEGPQKKATILALQGQLGSGKTTFLQGFAKGLGVKEKILSPTFLVVKKFPISNSQFSNFYHMDCYRIQSAKELRGLGFKKIISDPQNIIAIEWADRVKGIIPKHAIWLRFSQEGKSRREILM